ncbi:hypothetical protein MNBD_NITROSPINAE02-686 [hydrothermal vent metagenome]|uniref:Calcineurin-like phosphoesterase domain-containing protein n=1 Tax=hydrothermal vent metagenome TaxID=652676 RepID=A0A3B1C5B4_9ZZZZ
MFFIIATAIWASIHIYLGWRFIGPLALRGANRVYAWSLVAALFSFLPVTFIIGIGGGAPEWFGVIHIVTFILAGFTMIVFPLMLFRDVSLSLSGILVRLFGVITKGDGGHTPPDPGRRIFLLNSLNLGIGGTSAVLTTIGHLNTHKAPKVVRVDVPIKNLNENLDGMRIAQISDTHINRADGGDGLKRIVDITNSLHPQITAVTGDFVDGYVGHMRDHVKYIGDLKAEHGVYFVTGNHEYYWDPGAWLGEIKRLGLDILINEHRIITRSGCKIMIAGVTDYNAGRHLPSHKSDPVSAVKGAPTDCDFRLMLAHQPRSLYAVSGTDVDLQLSGHTHGGQFFPWNYLFPLFHPVGSGLTRFRNMWIYVNRGAAFWGPPLRLGAPAEITLITLRKA